MIKTITLNPAVDKTVEIDNFKTGEVNRISSLRVDAGGKGINVSKVIKKLEEESIALGIVGGNTGNFIVDYLKQEGIQSDFVRIDEDTRTNLKIVDKINHSNTDINELGPLVSKSTLKKIEDKLICSCSSNDIVVLSGSVPIGVDKAIYANWITKLKRNGVKTILDADGELLKEGIKACPNIVKPNIVELEGLFNEKFNSLDDVVSAAREILKYGVELVMVSMGGEGALYVSSDEVVKAHGIKVEVISTVGAGDSVVAALAVAIHRKYSFKDTVKLSMACGTANVKTTGSQAAELSEIMKIMKRVSFDSIR